MSNKKISILDMEKSNLEFKKSHYVSVSGFKQEGNKLTLSYLNDRIDKLESKLDAYISTPPKWFIEFVAEQREMWKQQMEFNKMVIDQFKKHGWIK